MKHLLFFFSGIMLFASTQSMAQISGSAGGTTKFTLGVSGGVTLLKGDFNKTNPAPAGKVNLDYNFTRHISAGVELQGGQLSEGNSATEWYTSMKNTPTFFGANLNIRLEAGQFTDKMNSTILHSLSGLYLGVGIGTVYSTGTPPRGSGDLVGPESASVITIPLSIGYNVPLMVSEAGVTKIILNINYQYNPCLNDKLDLYDYSSLYNNKKDAYSLISVGLRINLGSTIWSE